jgi:hypothetical protein
MPLFQVPGPDRMYEVDADSQELAQKGLEWHLAQQAPTTPAAAGGGPAAASPGGATPTDWGSQDQFSAPATTGATAPGYGAPEMFTHGATMGLSDPILGFGRDIGRGVTGGGFDWGRGAADIKAERDQYSAEHPYASTAANLTGAALTAPLLPLGRAFGAASRIADPLIRRAATWATGGALGAGIGGATAAIDEAPSGDLEQTAGAAARGAGVGAGLGLVLPPLAYGVGRAAQRGLDWWNVARPLQRELEVGPHAGAAVANALESDAAFTQGGRGEANLRASGRDGMMADAGPSSMGLLDIANQRGGPGTLIAREAIMQRGEAAHNAVNEALDIGLGRPRGVFTTQEAIRTGGAPTRDQAYEAAFGPTGASRTLDYSTPGGQRLEGLLRNVDPPVIARANQELRLAGLHNEQIVAQAGPNGVMTYQAPLNVRQLDAIKRGLQLQAESGETTGAMGQRNTTSRLMTNLASRIRDEVRDLVPEYGHALRIAGDDIGEINAVKFGADLLKPSLGRDEARAAIGDMSPHDVEAVRQGLRSQIDEKIANVKIAVSNPNADAKVAMEALKDLSSQAAREKLGLILTPDQMATMTTRLDEATRSAQLVANTVRNSGTYGRKVGEEAVTAASEPGAIGEAGRGQFPRAIARSIQTLTGYTPQEQRLLTDRTWAEIARLLTQRANPPGGGGAGPVLQGILPAMTRNEAVGQALQNAIPSIALPPGVQGTRRYMEGAPVPAGVLPPGGGSGSSTPPVDTGQAATAGGGGNGDGYGEEPPVEGQATARPFAGAGGVGETTATLPEAPQQYTVPGSAPRDMTPVPDTGRGTWWDNARQAAGDIGTAATGLAEGFNKGVLNTLGLRLPGSDIYRTEIPVAPGLARAGDVATFATGGLANSLFPAAGAYRAATGYAANAGRALAESPLGRSVARTAEELIADTQGSVPRRRGTPITMAPSVEEAAAARAAERATPEMPAEAAPVAKEAEAVPAAREAEAKVPVPEGVRAPGVAPEAPTPPGALPPEGVPRAAAEAPAPAGVRPPEAALPEPGTAPAAAAIPPAEQYNVKAFGDELRTKHKAQDNPLPLEGAKEVIVPPPHIRSEADLDALVDRYVEYARAGAVGKPWYNKSGQAIISHTGDQPRLADAVIGAVARTSPQTDVASNLGHAVTLNSQAMVGAELKGGRFPNAMGRDVEGYYYRGEPISGTKIGPFASASAREWNPDPTLHTLVNDIWNMRALEYPGKPGIGHNSGDPLPLYNGSPSNGQHNFARIVADRARAKLEALTGESWTPEQVQASAWTGVKAHHEGIPVTEAAGDFADAMANRYAMSPWESAPGRTSRHFPEYHTASEADKQAYHDAIHAAMTDDQGRDLVMLGLGLLTGKSTKGGSGYFKGDITPASQSFAVTGQAKGGALKGPDEASKTLMNTAINLHGLLGRQDATVWHRPIYAGENVAAAKQNLVEVDIGRSLTASETRAIASAMKKATGSNFFAPIAVADRGFRLLNDVAASGISNKKFADSVQKVLSGSALPDLKMDWAPAYGVYKPNNWNRRTYGEHYSQSIGAEAPPDVQRRAANILAYVGARRDEVDRHFAATRGWTPNDESRVWHRPEFKAAGHGYGNQELTPPQPGVDIRPLAEQEPLAKPIFPKRGPILSLGGLGLGLGLTGQSGLLPGEAGR